MNHLLREFWTKIKGHLQGEKDNPPVQRLQACPLCPENRLLSFIWPEEAFIDQLQLIKVLRSSENLLECKKCGAPWISQEKYLRSVENMSLLESWNQQTLNCPEKFLEVLHGIGKTNFLSIPCSIELLDGRHFQAAEVHFIEEAPVWLNFKQPIFLISQVKHLHPSSLALPQKVRQRLAEAWETRLGIPPTAVKANNQQIYLLHGIKDFFMQDGLTGSELTEMVQAYDPKTALMADYRGPQPVIVLADLEAKLFHW